MVTSTAALLLFSPALCAQSSDILDVSGASAQTSQSASKAPKQPFWSDLAGQGSIALEGYYLSASGQSTINTSGIDLNVKEYLPGIGVLDTSAEGAIGDGFHTGTMFVGLEQVPIFGWHWDFVGGDSQISSNLLGGSIENVATPDVSARGFSVAMKRKGRAYQVFYGDETILGGQRIPYRLQLPQTVLGATVKQSIGERLTFGVRFLHLDTNPDVLTSQSTFYFPGHVFRTSESIGFQSSYTLSKHMTVLGEVNYTQATELVPSLVAQHPVSFFSAWTWDTAKFTVKANYVSEGVSYLPLLASFSGDRRGPFVDGHYHVTKRLELTGSGELYSNNLEQNPTLPTFRSAGYSAGGSYMLPWSVSVDGSISTLHLTTMNPAQPTTVSDNQQISIDASRGFRRHSLRFSYIEMKLNDNSALQVENFSEVQDTFTWKHILLRGAVRYQNSVSTDTRNTFYVRSAVQINLKRLSAYAEFEDGKDLVNSSIFSTNAYSSTVIGFSVPVRGGWSVQAEASRNNLNTTVNPETVFLFPTANLAATQVPGFQQWSGYFRIGKSFRWGKAMSANIGIDQFAAERVPLVGSIQGHVMEQSAGGMRPCANVSVSLDSSRSVLTDSSGNYSFNDVAEGPHVVGLDMGRLPTDLEAGPDPSAQIVITPRLRVNRDFSVVRLIQLTGKVTAPPDTQIENVVVRLAGTDRYTTPDQDGSFSFYDLKEGDYTITIDAQTIPDGFILSTPASVQVPASSDNGPLTPIEFVIVVKPQPEKPIHRMLQQQIHVGSAPKPAAKPAPSPSSPSSPHGHDARKPKKSSSGAAAPPAPNKN